MTLIVSGIFDQEEACLQINRVKIYLSEFH